MEILCNPYNARAREKLRSQRGESQANGIYVEPIGRLLYGQVVEFW